MLDRLHHPARQRPLRRRARAPAGRTSGIPPAAVATIGRPKASALRMTLPNLSCLTTSRTRWLRQ
jgi:hypothetical protein